MKINSITETITNAIFSPLKSWAEHSPGNWNILIGSGFVLLVVGLILTFVFIKKMGKADERTNQIALKGSLCTLYALIFCDLLFPKEYMWQVFFLFKYSIAFVASGIYLAVRYKKDFLN
ncbi:DUF2178 domain-containing protein [Bacillus mojavensis]|uniref:DUF2178 domain-containing protein n=1 Tax=Bacillus mojavensis TaxID=72360 RepID=UPI002DB74322|nr:DUF2178 domain-containing protein [Bacillus mojavensis]MEC1290434.1 DUF2178 domain-containing protein [Bacillus mojavensis]MEC1702185.1 DUF2178 domain-containing protein [Bacillus mojavensis]MEC1734371.1 DUF2178 domain-containing protein [Bacillus mojavensis]MEC5246598.1 DUF2178 domain-containing protein [Bacillus mojavensis]MED1005303.1 DUF2178 domain-containing protein [Bacillus mojavensis]